jgi:hypothetical protein
VDFIDPVNEGFVALSATRLDVVEECYGAGAEKKPGLGCSEVELF